MRYTVLRLLVFFGVLIVCWLIGLRGILLLVIAALVSSIISVFLLVGPREQLAGTIDAKIRERRARAEQHRTHEDEDE